MEPHVGGLEREDFWAATGEMAFCRLFGTPPQYQDTIEL
jgi:hypothetical protein